MTLDSFICTVRKLSKIPILSETKNLLNEFDALIKIMSPTQIFSSTDEALITHECDEDF